MEFSKTLIDLAKMSPKKFATQIRKRNTVLLKKLMKLKPYLGKPLTAIPDEVWEYVTSKSSHGCPHCDGCEVCLWTKAAHMGAAEALCTINNACLGAKFDGVSINSMDACKIGGRICVQYGSGMELIDIYDWEPAHKLDKVSWNNCVRFVKAHIEWTKLPCWGEKCKKTD